MPEDYANSDFSLINVLQVLPSYPFHQEGDFDHVVYKLICRVKRTAYRETVPPLNSPMTAGASGIAASMLPFENAEAIFVGDYGHSHLPYDRLEFTREFATFPRNRFAQPAGSKSFSFPAFLNYKAERPKDDEEEYEATKYFTRNVNTTPAPVYVDTIYYFASQGPPNYPPVFSAVEVGNNFIGQFNGFVQDRDKEPGTYVRVNRTIAVNATFPSLAQYLDMIANGTKVVVEVSDEKYLGDIWRLRISKMRAQ